MNRFFFTTVAISLSLGVAAQAQTSPPVGGPAAKGNAPLKHVHTVNDGSAKPGANSFTEGQARQHILNSGYTDVTGLAKGKDGVWRGTAMHDGASVAVAMDFKGNVTEATSSSGAMSGAMSTPKAAPPAAAGGGKADAMSGANPPMAADAAPQAAMAHPRHVMHRRRHHHHHHHLGKCADPGPNGTACSGVSTMQNGVSDKETHAMQAGAHP